MNFDAVAPFYRLAETLMAGRLMERARGEFLPPALENAREILMLGDGPGRGLAQVLRRAHPGARITVIEHSERMIEVARSKVRKEDLARVNWVRADFREWPAPVGTRYDLVITQFFLDCFAPEDLERVVGKIALLLAPGGSLLLADFQVPAKSAWRRFRAQVILWVMHRTFRLVTRLESRRLTPPAPLLERAGLQLVARREFSAGLIYSARWQAERLMP